MDDLPGFFVNKKPVKVLLGVHHNPGISASGLSRLVGTTYGHTSNIIGFMVDNGLAVRGVQGRCKPVSLTEDGEVLAESFENVFKKLNVEVEV